MDFPHRRIPPHLAAIAAERRTALAPDVRAAIGHVIATELAARIDSAESVPAEGIGLMLERMVDDVEARALESRPS